MARKVDKAHRKAERKAAKERERVRLVVLAVQELQRAEDQRLIEQRARDLASVDLAHVQISAKLAGFPRAFGSRLYRRGFTPHEARLVFEAARRLPLQ